MQIRKLFQKIERYIMYAGLILGILFFITYHFQFIFGDMTILSRENYINIFIGLTVFLLPFLFHLIVAVLNSTEMLTIHAASQSLITFDENSYFLLTAKRFIDDAELVEIIGPPPESLLKTLLQHIKNNKKLIVALTLDANCNKNIILELLKAGKKVPTDAVCILHTSTASSTTTIICSNTDKNTINFISCTKTEHTNKIEGIQTSGNAALALANASRPWPSVQIHPLGDNDDGLLEIHSPQVLDAVIRDHISYVDNLKVLTRGIQLESTQAICDQMTLLLRNCKKSLLAVHMATSDESIALLEQEHFSSWLNLNYTFANKLKIQRIFVSEDLTKLATKQRKILTTTMQAHHDNGIEVLHCTRSLTSNKLSEQQFSDFTIYDNEHLLHIDKEYSHGWLDPLKTPKARHTQNPRKIAKFTNKFHSIAHYSRPFMP